MAGCDLGVMGQMNPNLGNTLNMCTCSSHSDPKDAPNTQQATQVMGLKFNIMSIYIYCGRFIFSTTK